jgi:hypothetical protein
MRRKKCTPFAIYAELISNNQDKVPVPHGVVKALSMLIFLSRE